MLKYLQGIDPILKTVGLLSVVVYAASIYWAGTPAETRLLSVLQTLSSALIATFIFHFFNHVVPQQRARDKGILHITNRIQDIESAFEELLSGLIGQIKDSKQRNKIENFRKLTQYEAKALQTHVKRQLKLPKIKIASAKALKQILTAVSRILQYREVCSPELLASLSEIDDYGPRVGADIESSQWPSLLPELYQASLTLKSKFVTSYTSNLATYIKNSIDR